MPTPTKPVHSFRLIGTTLLCACGDAFPSLGDYATHLYSIPRPTSAEWTREADLLVELLQEHRLAMRLTWSRDDVRQELAVYGANGERIANGLEEVGQFVADIESSLGWPDDVDGDLETEAA